MDSDNLRNGFREQEHRLLPAILFYLDRTSQNLLTCAVIWRDHLRLIQYMLIQAYSYTQYTVSIFKGNDLIRTAVAFGCILAARPMFISLVFIGASLFWLGRAPRGSLEHCSCTSMVKLRVPSRSLHKLSPQRI